jgi:conserved oligomeric Golgi complex subunit 2
MGSGSAATGGVPSNGSSHELPLPARPLCFNPQKLTPSPDPSAPPLDIPAFITAARANAPLSVMRTDLTALLETVHASLITSVQNSFSQFVSLGPALADVPALADAAAKPLASLHEDLTALLGSLDDDINALSATLSARRAAADRADSLRVLLRANDLLLKCERLLRDYSGQKSTDTEDALRLVERIAGEAAQLAFVLSRAGTGSFVCSMSVRVSVVRRSIRTHLEAWLRRALFPKRPGGSADGPYDADILTRVLGAYVVAGIGSDAEAFFRREIVAPFTSDRIRMMPLLAVAEREKKASAPLQRRASSSDADPAGLKSLSVTPADALEVAERAIVRFLGERVMPITSLCASEERLKTRLNFVGNSVWPQVTKAISSHMATAFSPGIPDVFHQSALSGSRIYAAVESAVVSDSQRDSLRRHSATVSFWHHWNLSVYFQLRFREIASTFDVDLQRGPVTISSAARSSSGGDRAVTAAFVGGGYRLLRSDMYQVCASVAMIDALRTCWSEKVYLKPLAHRFLRLSLQLLARYSTWVRTGLAGEWSGSDAIPAGAARVYSDISVMQQRVSAEFASLLRMRDSNIDEAILNDMDSAFSEAITVFSSLLPDLSRSMSDALSRSCVDNLQPLRGILATYRMPSKPAPTTNSPFVPKVLRPLKSFLQEQRGKLDNAACVTIATAVAEATTEKYYELATDLLNSNKKSEETLKRLNIGRGGSGPAAAARGGSGAISMTDKVSMQLYLDVAKFRDEIEALGVTLANVPSIARLWLSVRRDEVETPAEASLLSARGISSAASISDLETAPQSSLALPRGRDDAACPPPTSLPESSRAVDDEARKAIG